MPCCTVCELRPPLPRDPARGLPALRPPVLDVGVLGASAGVGASWGTGATGPGRGTLRIRSPLDGRVLDALAAEPDGVVGFQGLRRRLGAHPEALRRALRRLEEDGLAERVAGGPTGSEPPGYRATDEGACMAQPAPTEATEVLRVPLPPDVDAAAVAAALAGRWSGPLRPYARSEGPGETSVLFLREPEGTIVRVRLLAGLLIVEAEGGADAALLGHLFLLLSGVTGSGATASSSATGAHPPLAAPAAEEPA